MRDERGSPRIKNLSGVEAITLRSEIPLQSELDLTLIVRKRSRNRLSAGDIGGGTQGDADLQLATFVERALSRWIG